MSVVPSLAQIAKNFRQDVQLASWRCRRGDDLGPLVYEGGPKELLDNLLAMLAEYSRERSKQIKALRTAKDIKRRGDMARKILRSVQGLAKLPPRTPMKPRITPGFEREHYRLEHLVLETRPGFFQTSNLFFPKNFPAPWPAVLMTCGHTHNGKNGYHDRCVMLAAKGYLVLDIDPPGQGERDDYIDLATGQRTVNRACNMHKCQGDTCYLTGDNIGGYRLWDAMRAVDYLLSRKDVIGSRIGVTGASGGGWESLWLMAIDERLAACNSNCYTTSFKRRIEHRGVDAEGDPEQDPANLLSAGLEASDLLIACFPRPVSLGVTTRDIFPYDGAMATYREARKVYGRAGLADRLGITVGDAGHKVTPEMMQQTFRWFGRHLKGEASPNVEIPQNLPKENEADINCTPTGIVLTSLGGKSVGELNARQSRELALARAAARKGRTPKAHARFVRKTLADLLKFKPLTSPMRPKLGDVVWVKETSIVPVEIRGDGKTILRGRLWLPAGDGRRPATIVMQEKPIDYAPLSNGLCRQLAEMGQVVLDLDVRGLGPLQERWANFEPLIMNSLAADAFLVGRPLLGLWAADAVRALDFLQTLPQVDAGRVTVAGRENLALVALFAAVLDERFAACVEDHPLVSYSAITFSRDYAWTSPAFLPDVLKHIDLDDVRAALAPRPLGINWPLDARKDPLSARAITREFAFVRAAYTAAGAKENLSIVE